MNRLIALLTVLCFKVIAADHCIGQVIAIFAGGYSGNELNILTKEHHFVVKKYQINNPPFLNLYYDIIEDFPVNSKLSDQFALIIDIDYYQHQCYALKREHKTVKLMQIDLETGETSNERDLSDPDALQVKSFVITGSSFLFYFQLADRTLVKNYSFILNEDKIDLQLIEGQEKEFQFEFSRVAYLNSKNNDLKYAFLRDLDLYLNNEPTMNNSQTLDRYNVINLNRLTKCLSTLCSFKRIDGFIRSDNQSDLSKHIAVVVNSNYFFVRDIININGSKPVLHFPHYERIRFAFTCEVLFTIDKKNFCFRDKKFYKIEYVDEEFDIQVLVATTQDPFVENFNLSPAEFLTKWLEFKERPIAVLKLFNKAVVLFASSYTIWTTETKSYETKNYENLFPNHDPANLIMHAFYDQPTKRYLFVGSKFNFIYRHSQLNEHNQFYENFIPLSEPLYTNCVQPITGEHPQIVALILAIFICLVLVILLIIFIYCRHCRHRTPLQTQPARRTLGRVSSKSKSKMKMKMKNLS